MPGMHRYIAGTVITFRTWTPRTAVGWNSNTQSSSWVCYSRAAQCYFQKRKKLIRRTVPKNHRMPLNSAVHGWSRGFKNAGGRRTTSVPSKQSIHLKSPLTPGMKRGPFLIKRNFNVFCKKWNVQITAFSKTKGCFFQHHTTSPDKCCGEFWFHSWYRVTSDSKHHQKINKKRQCSDRNYKKRYLFT